MSYKCMLQQEKSQDEEVRALYSKLNEMLEKLTNREFTKIWEIAVGATKEDHDLREAVGQ